MRIILFVCFVTLSAVLLAQEKFHIIHVTGEIILKSTGKALKPRDVITPSDEIIFKSKNAVAAALSSKRGRYIIQPAKKDTNSNELTAFVKNVISSSSGKLSTRGILNTTLDLQNYFQGKHAFLDGEALITIHGKSYPINDTHFFYLRYNYKGEPINKKLPAQENMLKFSASEIYMIDDQAIDQSAVENCELFYYKSDEKASEKIGSFTPVFPDNEQLKDEVNVFLEVYGENDQEHIKEEIAAFIEETYGKISMDDLNYWMSNHFNI